MNAEVELCLQRAIGCAAVKTVITRDQTLKAIEYNKKLKHVKHVCCYALLLFDNIFWVVIFVMFSFKIGYWKIDYLFYQPLLVAEKCNVQISPKCK